MTQTKKAATRLPWLICSHRGGAPKCRQCAQPTEMGAILRGCLSLSMYHGRSCAIDELQSEKLRAMRAGRHFGLQHVGSLIRSPSLISLPSTEAAKFLATCLDEARPMVLTLQPQVRGDGREPQGS